MPLKRTLLRTAAIACLAGCAATPPTPPDTERYHCVEIPSDLVECSLKPET
jgi:hypothetical protein